MAAVPASATKLPHRAFSLHRPTPTPELAIAAPVTLDTEFPIQVLLARVANRGLLHRAEAVCQDLCQPYSLVPSWPLPRQEPGEAG